ncbi:alpha-hydroxy-acid oxidizing protein [Colwelliaceae bacterium 6471]
MAMGADVCMIGRAWAYTLPAQREKGVIDMLTNMKNEMRVAITLTGVTQISELNKNIIR